VVGVLGALSLVHFLRVRRALGDPRHSELARTIHSMRERRAF